MLIVQLGEGFHFFECNGAFFQNASANIGDLLSMPE